MGSKFTGGDDVIADINITPFVDIILVVLIIFMVTSPIIAKNAIKVNLPDAATGDPTKATSLGITLLADGGLLLDGQPTTPDGLKAAIALARAKDGDEVVCLIAADKSVAHGRVVWLIDFVKSEKVVKFAINIDKTEEIGPDPATIGEGTAIVPVTP